MSSLPDSQIYLLVRTYFGDDAGWESLKAVIEAGSDEGSEQGFFANVEYVDDRQFEGVSSEGLEAVHPHRADGWDVLYIADERAVTEASHPLLLVRVGSTEDQSFRCRADALYEIDANLSLANLDWDDFRDQVGASGIYGEAEPPRRKPDNTALPASALRDAARSAMQRVERGLDDPSKLSGRRDTVRVIGIVPGDQSQVFYQFASPTWLTQGGYSVVNGYRLFRGEVESTFWEDANRIVPRDGTIECTYKQADESDAVVVTWQWMRRPDGQYLDKQVYSLPPESLVPILEPATVRFRVTSAPATSDEPSSTVEITHENVPGEWVEALTAYWQWILERVDLDLHLGG